MIKLKTECTNSSGIASKIDYGLGKQKEIYYFGKKPDRPKTMHDYLKSKRKNK